MLMPLSYRGANKGLYVLLSRTQAGPSRTVKQEQEEISRNLVQTFISPSVWSIERDGRGDSGTAVTNQAKARAVPRFIWSLNL